MNKTVFTDHHVGINDIDLELPAGECEQMEAHIAWNQLEEVNGKTILHLCLGIEGKEIIGPATLTPGVWGIEMAVMGGGSSKLDVVVVQDSFVKHTLGTNTRAKFIGPIPTFSPPPKPSMPEGPRPRRFKATMEDGRILWGARFGDMIYRIVTPMGEHACYEKQLKPYGITIEWLDPSEEQETAEQAHLEQLETLRKLGDT